MKQVVCPICGKKYMANKHCKSVRVCDDCSKVYRKEQVEKYKMDNNILDPLFSNNTFYRKKKKIIQTLIKYFHFDSSVLNDEEKTILEWNRVKNVLYDFYWNKHMSGRKIAEQFNYPNGGNIVSKIFRYLEIPVRNLKDSVINAYLEGDLVPNNTYVNCKHGWHTTWDGNKVYLRSSYEYDYASVLDKDKIKYEVESLRIKYFDSILNEYHCAIPDFYLPDTNTIVEVKSTYTLDSVGMYDRKKHIQKTDIISN